MTAVTIELGDDEDLGPAMSALTARERAWVLTVVALGGNRKEAAKVAGYGNIGTKEQQEAAQRQAASRLSRSPKVQAAIVEEAEARLKSGGLLAADALEQMVIDTAGKNHFKAVQAMLDRAGLVAVQRQEIVVRRETLTDAQIDEKIKMLTKTLAEANLLPSPARGERIVDAAFEGAPTTDGLEDLFA